jgi:hypothetical protein
VAPQRSKEHVIGEMIISKVTGFRSVDCSWEEIFMYDMVVYQQQREQ